MGTLYYGMHSFALDDRLLSHLQVVITLKLRRGEHFFLSWRGDSTIGRKRASVWIDNGVPIMCEYEGGRAPAINRTWITELAESANSSYGLMITDETIIPIPIDATDVD
ncbi:DUF7882 family protein [Leifsonia sp. 2MCAF36]|uniref:DUF7882 family protein n=1 Tax=Leifsonia sp. 2MCAF36 TaxID=3232988 RepID=UPI003F95C0E0